MKVEMYAVSLSAYSNNVECGDWVDITHCRSEADILELVQNEILNVYGGEEWAVHDWGSLSKLDLGEYPNLDHLALILEMIGSQGDKDAVDAVVAYFMAFSSDDDTSLQDFEDRYEGSFPRMLDYTYSVLDNMGYSEDNPEYKFLINYFDHERYWQEVDNGSVRAVKIGDNYHFFDLR